MQRARASKKRREKVQRQHIKAADEEGKFKKREEK